MSKKEVLIAVIGGVIGGGSNDGGRCGLATGSAK